MAGRAQADDLRVELADFDQLRGGTLSTFDAASLEELSTVLVKARIARGWTQRQLAEALGMAEQQIQRYEANDYRSTSLARLCDIANALAVTVAWRLRRRGVDARVLYLLALPIVVTTAFLAFENLDRLLPGTL